MSKFVISKDEVKKFGDTPTLKNMKGIFYLYQTEETVIKELLPKPLEYVAPVVIGYFVGFTNTTFGGPYMEFMIGTPATYKGQIGVYPISLMLSGYGAEMAVVAGTNCVGFPKKIADNLTFTRNGDDICCQLERHGVVLFECKVKVDGSYNVQGAKDLLGMNKQGDVVPGAYFVHHLNYMQTENGNMAFLNVDLAELFTEHTVKDFVPSKLTEIKVASSPDDPYGELKVVEPMGAVYFETDGITMKGTKKLEELDADNVLPYIMTSRFDRGMFGDAVEYMTNISSK